MSRFDAAKYLGIPLSHLDRLADAHAINPVAGEGRRAVYDPDDLEAFVERCKADGMWPLPLPRPGRQRTTLEVSDQMILLARFGEAWVSNVGPLPCPVCGEEFGRADIAAHLLDHR